MKRIPLAVVLLAAACATAPQIAEPLLLDFRWEPPFTEVSSGFGTPKEIEQRREMLALAIRNTFETRFPNVVLGAENDDRARVTLTMAEFGRPHYSEDVRLSQSRAGGSQQRCGTVDYEVFVGGRAISREEFPLDCDTAGRPDYQRAGLRAAEGVARAVGGR